MSGSPGCYFSLVKIKSYNLPHIHTHHCQVVVERGHQAVTLASPQTASPWGLVTLLCMVSVPCGHPQEPITWGGGCLLCRRHGR